MEERVLSESALPYWIRNTNHGEDQYKEIVLIYYIEEKT